ncbi:hypothetical protein AAFC00_000125 [Neodothiora populina]|uniref:Zn(2)-C6 fungal-type domain-containing protein n=1 Tax=Neodothiora populina TaxID=2781224 RepID=A0ABR3P209_9PEZI
MADALSLTTNAGKRKRSPSAPSATPASTKLARTTTTPGNQLQINYLARQCADDLPFISKEDTLPNLLEVLTSYTHVLDRQESLASNLGARPLGPILIKRFERCFDGPPKIIASHSHAKGTTAGSEEEAAPTVTWLDVVHFAQAHPAQFDLATFSEGRRVCQFYYPQKQVRVQVSEEDFLFISSGRCQDLIPPLPIWEDEEKEVATCEILERALREVTNAADLVAARTRQLGHRLKGRRMAIQERRSEQGPQYAASNSEQEPRQTHTPPTVSAPPSAIAGTPYPTLSTPARTSVNPPSLPHNQPAMRPENRRTSQMQVASPMHGTPQPLISSATVDTARPPSTSVSPVPAAAPPTGHGLEQLSYYMEKNDPFLPSSFTPANMQAPDGTPRHNFSRPLPPSQESSQPYRSICQTHMEGLPRGSRVLPPCDRCRRLRMDCLKNLSSCAGCTKKHARCHWKEVRLEEVQGLEGFVDDVTSRKLNDTHAYESNVTSNNGTHSYSDNLDDNNPGPPSATDSQRMAIDDRNDQNGGTAAQNLPPLRRNELEQQAQASMSINHAQQESMQAQESQRTHSNQAPNAQLEHESEEVQNGASSISFSKRTETEDSHHAMDLLRLLSREATNIAGGQGGAGAGARNNGAFRSVYNPQSAEPEQDENTNNASSSSSGGNALGLALGLGVAGGDRH